MNGNRQVGGLWCTEVLAGLSDYLDGDLAPPVAAQVEAHVSACTNCARFGAEVSGMIEVVARQSQQQQRGTVLPEDIAQRLRAAVLSAKP